MMKKLFELVISLFLVFIFCQSVLAQTCQDGSYQWSDVSAIFSNNGCATSACHGGAAGGLDLTTFTGFNTGGTKCSTEISTGTVLVDIIETGATCADGSVAAMNNNIATPLSQTDIDALQVWIDGGAFELCRGVATTEGACTPASTVNALTPPTQTTLCSDGSDAPVFAAPTASLPDVQIAIEVNGVLADISSDGTFDMALLAVGDEVCYTGFAFDLAEINNLLNTANSLCAVLGCDGVFGIPGIDAAIIDLVNGNNDGNPGLNDLNEALTFAGSFGSPIQSAQSAAATLVSLNNTIGAFSLGPVCFATTDYVCLNVAECTPEPGIGTTEGLCTPTSQVDVLTMPGQTTICSNGSDAPTFSSASNSLPDVQIAIEVNGLLVDISSDGIFDTNILNENDNVCYTAFAFDLADINSLLTTAGTLCVPLDCDDVFGIPGLEAAITALLNGDNDGVPGLNDLNEALTFAGSFGTPIESVLDATTTLISLNEAIGGFGLGPVCFATSDFVCLPVVTCGPCSGTDVEVVFSLDMSCSGTTERPPIVTGPFNGFSGDGNIMEDPDGDDIWEAVICATPGTMFEYKYAILNFTEQENLIDDAQGGGTCAPITDFFSYANREITIPAGGGALPTDAYGICGTCANPPLAVTFTVNMNCSTVPAGTPLAITGAFNGYCDGCAPMDDSDGDGIWEASYVFPPDANGCYVVNYLYQAPNWGNAEDFLNNGEDLTACDNIDTDFSTYANRSYSICQDMVIENFWNTCNNSLAGGCTDPAFCEYDPEAVCDDSSLCLTPNTDPGSCNNDCFAGDIEIWDPTSCTCIIFEVSVFGCMNPSACNYDINANCDDGSCILSQNCDDNDCTTDDVFDASNCICVFTPNGLNPDDGCELTDDSIDPATCAIINTSNCPPNTEFSQTQCACIGCTDACDPNFAPGATANNDLFCAGYSTDCDDGDCSTNDVFNTATCACENTPTTCPTGEFFNPQTCICEATCTAIGCTDANACNFNASACEDDGSCDALVGSACTDGTGNSGMIGNDCSCIADPIPGCTDNTACNYNMDANMEDGSCTFPETNFDCNGNCTATVDCEGTCGGTATTDCEGNCNGSAVEGSACTDANGNTGMYGTDCTCIVGAFVQGCTDNTACNYNMAADIDDGSCTYPPANFDCDGNCIATVDCAGTCGGTVLVDCENNCGGNAIPGSSCTDTNGIDGIYGSDCSCSPSAILGCTNTAACNYNTTATADDGSCQLPGDACNDFDSCTTNDILQADCSCAGVLLDEDQNGVCDLVDIATVPTMGEWGLLLLSLLLLNFVCVSFLVGSIKLQGFNNQTINYFHWQNLSSYPFQLNVFKKALKITLCLLPFIWCIIIAAYGFITFTDVVGLSLTIPVLAYLLHLLMMANDNKHYNK